MYEYLRVGVECVWFQFVLLSVVESVAFRCRPKIYRRKEEKVDQEIEILKRSRELKLKSERFHVK